MAGIGEYKMVKLYQYAITKDSSGDNVETLSLRYRTFADVVDTGGGRSVERSQVGLSDIKQFKIRWRDNWLLDSKWFIKYFGKQYAISKIERINEKRFNWLITADA